MDRYLAKVEVRFRYVYGISLARGEKVSWITVRDDRNSRGISFFFFFYRLLS